MRKHVVVHVFAIRLIVHVGRPPGLSSILPSTDSFWARINISYSGSEIRVYHEMSEDVGLYSYPQLFADINVLRLRVITYYAFRLNISFSFDCETQFTQQIFSVEPTKI